MLSPLVGASGGCGSGAAAAASGRQWGESGGCHGTMAVGERDLPDLSASCWSCCLSSAERVGATVRARRWCRLCAVGRVGVSYWNALAPAEDDRKGVAMLKRTGDIGTVGVVSPSCDPLAPGPLVALLCGVATGVALRLARSVSASAGSGGAGVPCSTGIGSSVGVG